MAKAEEAAEEQGWAAAEDEGEMETAERAAAREGWEAAKAAAAVKEGSAGAG